MNIIPKLGYSPPIILSVCLLHDTSNRQMDRNWTNMQCEFNSNRRTDGNWTNIKSYIFLDAIASIEPVMGVRPSVCPSVVIVKKMK